MEVEVEVRKAQSLINEYLGHLLNDDVTAAMLIVLVQADILGRPELNYIKKWVEDARQQR